MNLPSIKTLASVFGDKAKDIRRILEMTRAELEDMPAGEARINECYHPPTTADLRMHVLDSIIGTHGVEGFLVRDGRQCDYLNTGGSYAATLIRFNGRYIIGCWEDIVERYGAE